MGTLSGGPPTPQIVLNGIRENTFCQDMAAT